MNKKRKINLPVLAAVIAFLLPLPVLGQEKYCLGNDFIIAQKNSTVSVGDIYVGKSKKEFTLSFSREKLLKRSGDNTLLHLKEDSIIDCSVDVTKNYKAGFGVDMSYQHQDSIYASIVANYALIKAAKMEIKDGKKISLKNGVSDINDILGLLDLHDLQSMLTDIKKGKKAVLITEAISVKDGYTNIHWKKEPKIDLKGNIEAIKGNITYTATDSMNLYISYKQNVTVGYKCWPVTRNEIEQIICEKQNADGINKSKYCSYNNSWRYAPFGIHQFLNDKTWEGVAFAGLQGGFIIGSAYCFVEHVRNKRYVNTTQDEEKSKHYWQKQNNYMWGGLGCLLGFAVSYGANLICNKKEKRNSSLVLIPSSSPQSNQLLLVIKF
jgi:TM2 domain-containing membrane protein YozV